MKKQNFSIILSIIFTFIFLICLITLCFIMPGIIRWYYALIRGFDFLVNKLITCFYICVPFGFLAIYLILRLLFDFLKSQIFIKQNVLRLKILSICCFLVAIITLIFGFYYFPLFIICIAASFVSLILSIISSIWQSAVIIKNENELTI